MLSLKGEKRHFIVGGHFIGVILWVGSMSGWPDDWTGTLYKVR
jgi:hypothetical protein